MGVWWMLSIALVAASPYLAGTLLLVIFALVFSKASEPKEPPKDGP